MSDRQEIIKVLAEKVMGWKLLDREAKGWGKGSDVYATGNEYSPTRQDLDPFANSADNDALIEAFLQDPRVADFLIERKRMDMSIGRCFVHMQFPRKGTTIPLTRFFSKAWGGNYTTAKKNEAVCMAIYEAVKK